MRAQQIFDWYRQRVDLVVSRIEPVESSIRETAEWGPCRRSVAALRCVRSADALTALGIATEIGDFSRGYELARRQPGQNTHTVEHWPCQQGLHTCGQRMAGRLPLHV